MPNHVLKPGKLYQIKNSMHSWKPKIESLEPPNKILILKTVKGENNVNLTTFLYKGEILVLSYADWWLNREYYSSFEEVI